MFSELLLVSILCYLTAKFVKLLRRHRRMREMALKVPGDPGPPIFGNLLQLGRDTKTMPQSVREFGNRRIEAGDNVLRLLILHQVVFVPLDGEALKYILDSTEEITKGDDYDVFEPWLGRGLLTSTGDKWRSRRKLLTPTFHFSMLDGYVYSMNQHAKILVSIFEEKLGHEFDIYPYIKRCALDIICDTAMGKQLNAQSDPEQPYVAALHEIMTIGMAYSMKPLLWIPGVKWISGIEQRFRRSIKTARDFTRGVITDRMESIAHGEVEPSRRAFLDILIAKREEQGLTLDDIQEEVDTFMFAGHDTTSSGLTWTLWCFACNPEIQQRAYEEIAEVFGTHGDNDECNREHISKLSYLDRCMKEAMRLFPPVPFIIRELQNDFKMGEYNLPKGASLTISPFIVHHNKRIYPNSEIYDPDNFLPERAATRHPYDYIPFSAGPRNCIGQKFAQHEEKIILTWLLRRFKFESSRPMMSNGQLSEVVLKPELGTPLTIRRR